MYGSQGSVEHGTWLTSKDIVKIIFRSKKSMFSEGRSDFLTVSSEMMKTSKSQNATD